MSPLTNTWLNPSRMSISVEKANISCGDTKIRHAITGSLKWEKQFSLVSNITAIVCYPRFQNPFRNGSLISLTWVSIKRVFAVSCKTIEFQNSSFKIRISVNSSKKTQLEPTVQWKSKLQHRQCIFFIIFSTWLE